MKNSEVISDLKGRKFKAISLKLNVFAPSRDSGSGSFYALLFRLTILAASPNPVSKLNQIPGRKRPGFRFLRVHFFEKNGASGSWAEPYFACSTLRYEDLTYTPGISCSAGYIKNIEKSITLVITHH
ncbi:hypothetical protein AAFN85_23205 [Mucilaginibacter sp. CAU 1740]|uniref:hypothetical protein n=1 Tax=Mucilaginibacter sp. CAU 1740 TaxID=3140365 RepID=UPI00325A8BFF